ncbi:MAG TPA: 2-C-methyl-D-erythritol 4-phosphate cytidylyltransferase [Candidatus Cloacimonadota bacterium]|nr:2-C-methyl-D-erythritol 4-phosphate cytidylyltransferase [Candidatus Cloacimonadota bacterium]
MEKLSYNCAIITAAGSGSRMGSGIKKQFRPLGGIPVLIRTLGIFMESPLIDSIIITAPETDLELCRELILQYFGDSPKPWKVIPGGVERQDSIFGALQSCPEETDFVFIHDAVRPFITLSLIEELYAAVQDSGAVIPVARLKHTIKEVEGDLVQGTLERGSLVQVFTPQVFAHRSISLAYARAFEDGITATDDAAIMEHSGYPVRTLLSSELNLKITDDLDWFYACLIIDNNMI